MRFLNIRTQLNGRPDMTPEEIANLREELKAVAYELRSLFFSFFLSC